MQIAEIAELQNCRNCRNCSIRYPPCLYNYTLFNISSPTSLKNFFPIPFVISQIYRNFTAITTQLKSRMNYHTMINGRYTPPTREVKRVLHKSYIAQRHVLTQCVPLCLCCDHPCENTIYNAFALTGRGTHNGMTITQGAASLCPGLCAFAISGRARAMCFCHFRAMLASFLQKTETLLSEISRCAK